MATQIKNFSVVVTEILDDYSADVREAVGEAVEKAGKKALASVKKRSPVSKGKKGGRYKKGWRMKKEVGGIYRDQVTAVIYNKQGSLVHLIENGHQKANGGRVEGIPHVQPAMEEAEHVLTELTARAIEEAGNR